MTMMNIQRIYISGGYVVKRMLIAMTVLLASTTTADAAELMVKVPVDEYQETKAQLEEMQKKLNELELKMQQSQGGGEQYSTERLKKMDRDISEIYDTLDQVETRALLDRVNLGAEVRVRMDNYRVKDYEPMYVSALTGTWTTDPYIEDERNDSNWSSRFRINMEADVYKTVKFSARLALLKNWADSVGAFNHDNNRAHVANGDTNLKVDRFYIDWTPKFFVPVAISFGRLPTSDGPPLEYKENRKRQSIYPALIFDGEPDGIVAAVGLERYLKLKNAGVRYFYAMAVQYDNEHASMNYLDTVTDDMYKDNRVQALFFETELPGLRDSLLVLSYVPANDILMSNPMTGEMDNVGDITLWGAHLQLADLFGTGIDLFGSYGENRNEPSGNTMEMDGVHRGLMSSYPDGFMGMGADMAPTDTTTGRAWYAGLRYEIPVAFLNRPKIGVEYNKGNQYWFSYTPGSSEIFNRLATRGEAFDAYYIQPFNDYIFLRTGYTKIKYDYAGSGMPIGHPADYSLINPAMGTNGKNPEFHNFYVLLDARF